VCLDDLRVGPEIERRMGTYVGGCVHISYCLADQDLRPGYDCYYTDLTRVREQPPVEVCPRDASDVFRFCGPNCGDCPDPDASPSGGYQGCVGLGGERGVGLCALDEACVPGSYLLEPEAAANYWGGTQPTACLVQRDPDTGEYWEWGWTVGAPACIAYRERYPEAFDCRDIDWESLP